MEGPTDAGNALLSEKLAGRSRAMLVFGEDAAAEAFRVIEGFGPKWEMVKNYAAPEATELLRVCGTSRWTLRPD